MDYIRFPRVYCFHFHSDSCATYQDVGTTRLPSEESEGLSYNSILLPGLCTYTENTHNTDKLSRYLG